MGAIFLSDLCDDLPVLSAFGSSSRKDELTPVGPQTGLIPFCGIASSAEICFIRNVGMGFEFEMMTKKRVLFVTAELSAFS